MNLYKCTLLKKDSITQTHNYRTVYVVAQYLKDIEPILDDIANEGEEIKSVEIMDNEVYVAPRKRQYDIVFEPKLFIELDVLGEEDG